MGGGDGGRANTGQAQVHTQEELCRRCGRCCHHKVRFGDVVVLTDISCEFLDPVTKLCRVYPDRFRKQPLCSTAMASAAAGTLPDDCPYVGGRSNYTAPLLLADHPEYEKAITALFPGRLIGEKAAKSLLRRARHGSRKRQ